MNLAYRTREILLLSTVAILVSLAWLLPTIPLAPHYHDFADQRSLLNIHCAMDVLSNAPFALWGIWGLLILRRTHNLNAAQRQTASLFFVGLITTAVASGYYHLAPNDAGLAIDRYGMSFAFAGLMGLATATRISDRAGMALSVASLALGFCAVWVCEATGNMTPWVVFQAGGMVLLLGLLVLPRVPGGLEISWLAIVLIYVAAKVLEMGDQTVFHFTGWVSGHTLKHVVAGLAAWPIIHGARLYGSETH